MSESPKPTNSPADATEASGGNRLLYCHCAYSRVVPKDVKGEVLEALAESGRAFDAVPDLCELAARCDPSLKKLADPGQGDVDIVACYPRAVRWLFHAAESPLAEDGVRIHNMRVDSAGSILGDLGLAPHPEPEAEADTSEPETDSAAESTADSTAEAPPTVNDTKPATAVSEEASP